MLVPEIARSVDISPILAADKASYVFGWAWLNAKEAARGPEVLCRVHVLGDTVGRVPPR